METQKTAICPNCGATITNMQNCEFCGSLLIRLQQQGINIEQSDYKKKFQGLLGALKSNLDLQKSLNHQERVVTDIYIQENGKNEPLCAVTNFLGAFSIISSSELIDYDKDHLLVAFSFNNDNTGGDELYLRRFRGLDIYELFTEKPYFVYGTKTRGYEYTIDFGSDAEGAARLISRVIYETYGVPYDTNLDYYTNSGNYIQKCRIILSKQGRTNYSWVWWSIGIAAVVIWFLNRG
jgi:hypothetical protein